MNALKEVDTADQRQPIVEGRIDAVENDKVFGWAWDRANPDTHLDVEIWLDETLLGTVRADQPREDLKTAGLGAGDHAFVFPAPTTIAANDMSCLRAIAKAGTGAGVPIQSRNEAEILAERVLNPSLNRILEVLENGRRLQQQIRAAQQTTLQGVRDLCQSNQPSSEIALLRLEMEAIRGSHEALEKQINGLEVFVTRFDTSLQNIDRRLDGIEKRSAKAFLNGWANPLAVIGGTVAGALASVLLATL